MSCLAAARLFDQPAPAPSVRGGDQLDPTDADSTQSKPFREYVVDARGKDSQPEPPTLQFGPNSPRKPQAAVDEGNEEIAIAAVSCAPVCPSWVTISLDTPQTPIPSAAQTGLVTEMAVGLTMNSAEAEKALPELTSGRGEGNTSSIEAISLKLRVPQNLTLEYEQMGNASSRPTNERNPTDVQSIISRLAQNSVPAPTTIKLDALDNADRLRQQLESSPTPVFGLANQAAGSSASDQPALGWNPAEATILESAAARVESVQPSAAHSRVANTLSLEIPAMTEQGSAQLRLQLRGPELQVTVRTPHPAVASALSSEVPALAQSLENAGFRVDRAGDATIGVSFRETAAMDLTRSDTSSTADQRHPSTPEHGQPDSRRRDPSRNQDPWSDEPSDAWFGIGKRS